MDTKSKSCCSQKLDITSQKREANSCVALGTGVGALGIGAALITGAVCPLCYVIAPGLIGVGLLRHRNINKKEKKRGSNE